MAKTDRFYFNGSRYVPSGTTVLPSPELMDWAAKLAVESLINSPVPLTKLDSDKAVRAYKQESMQAADYGTYVHLLCELTLKGQEIESPDEMTNGFLKQFRAWIKKHNVKPIAQEYEVVTDTYGGRLDLVCEMDGVVTLVDFKTGKGTYYETWKYQLAGYRQAYNQSRPYEPVAMFEVNGNTEYLTEQKGQIERHGILQFNKKTGKVNYKDFTEYKATRTNPQTLEKEKYTRNYETDRQTFNSLVANWWLTKRGIQI